MSKPLRIGLLGLGTVGQGLLRVLAENRSELMRRAGRELVVTRAAARDLSKTRDCPLANVVVGDDPTAVVAADDVDVVVEVMGGLQPAGDLIMQALALAKPVVTANKALVAEDGNRIFAQAQKHGVWVAFDAAVAGSVPVVRAIREGLAGNRIDEVAGIINGTCNYILCQMQERGLSFEVALKDAQNLGYAEADPQFDIEGIDAAHKLTILAAIAFGMPLAYDRVVVEGITGVQLPDLQLAKELGYRIKHLGIAKRRGDKVELRVHPTLVPERHLLANVGGALNAVMVQGNASGPVTLHGRGAGAEATASAIASDLVEVARLLGVEQQRLVPPLAFAPNGVQDIAVVSAADFRSAYYVRLRVADAPGVLRAITEILAQTAISIEAILQKEPRSGEDASVAIITSQVSERELDGALQSIRALSVVHEDCVRFRVEHFSE